MQTKEPSHPCVTVRELLKSGNPLLSVEFFPPKNKAAEKQMLATAASLKENFQPDFVSITYGAGGSTRDRTLQFARLLKEEYSFHVMPHLTCVGSSLKELEEIVQTLSSSGFRNIMALRGDPPKGESKFVPAPDGLSYGNELVSFLQDKFSEIDIGVAGYPEKHPEAATLDEDIEYLRQKVEAGATFVTTQLFYDNSLFFDFVQRCRQVGIEVPIFAGIMPVRSWEQTQRFCAMCGASIPSKLGERLGGAKDETEVLEIGIDWAYRQMAELLAENVPGIHLYALNQSSSANAIYHRLQQGGCFKHRNL